MIYTTNYQSQVPQNQARQIIQNKQNSLIQAPVTQNSIYNHQSNLSNQGSITLQQQVPSINQQTNLNQAQTTVLHHQASPSNYIVNNPNQQQNQSGQIEKLLISSNQNQVSTGSFSGSIAQQQQQQQQKIQQQYAVISNNSNNQQQLCQNQVIAQNSSPTQNQQYIQNIYARQISDTGSPQSSDYRNVYQIQNQQLISAQIQPINRYASLQAQNSASVYVQNNNTYIPTQQQVQDNNKVVNDQQEKMKKSFSSSFHEKSENFILSTPQKQNIVPVNIVNSSVQNDQSIKNNYYIQPTTYNQCQQIPQYPNTHQYFIIKNQPNIQIIPQQLQNQQNLTDSQYYQNQSQTNQGFIPISNSLPTTNNTSNNQSAQFSQQIKQNTLYSSAGSLSSHKQSFLVDNNGQLYQNNFQQQQSFKDYSPYDKLFNSKMNNKNGDESILNKSNQNNQKTVREYDTLIGDNVITPKKQNILNSGELSQRSDIIAIDTTDADIRDRFYSNSKIQTGADGNQINFIYRNIEVDNSEIYQSPRNKLKIKEKKYGNEDLCNFYPISHTKVDDLQKYDLVIKCTLKKQNQTAINQIIKEFSDGLQFSTQ